MSASQPVVPLCDLNVQYRGLQKQIEAAVARVLASGQVINGPEVAAFERECAEYLGAKHAIGCSSGTDALLLALHALDIKAGDEVILPPFTFFANGAPFGQSAFTRQGSWMPDGPGYVTVSVVDSKGRSDMVKVFLD